MSLSEVLPAEGRRSFRLIFHIGAGKTGTSSIQASLHEATAQLQADGCDYWGLMLESAPAKLYDWQKASASTAFLELEPALADEQVRNVLSQSITELRKRGLHTAIWSNEWFFGRHQNVIPALKAIEGEGVRIEIIAYVRRHDAWAKSAYVQWGLKHKTYSGPLMPFREYILKRPVRFAGTLQPWVDAFPQTFMMRNFDTAGDVVPDFLAALGLPAGIPSLRVNEAPGPEELVLRALFNNGTRGEALPVEFDRLLRVKQIDFEREPLSWLNQLLPSDADLAEIINISTEDREQVNRMLAGAGQLPVGTDLRSSAQLAIDQNKMLSILFQIIALQARKLQRLQRDVMRLEEGAGHDEADN